MLRLRSGAQYGNVSGRKRDIAVIPWQLRSLAAHKSLPKVVRDGGMNAFDRFTCRLNDVFAMQEIYEASMIYAVLSLAILGVGVQKLLPLIDYLLNEQRILPWEVRDQLARNGTADLCQDVHNSNLLSR